MFKFVEIVRVHSFIKDEIVQYYLIYKSVWEIWFPNYHIFLFNMSFIVQL